MKLYPIQLHTYTMQPIKTTVIISIIAIFNLSYGTSALQLNQQGVDACKKEEFKKGVVLLTNALKLAPDNQTIAGNLTAASRNYAAEQFNEGDKNGATTTLRNAMQLLPNSTFLREDLIKMLYIQGMEYLKNRLYSEAQNNSSEALQYNPDNSAANILAGEVAYTLHDIKKALLHFQRAHQLDPLNSNITSRIEQLQIELGSEKGYSRTEAYHFDIRFDYKTLGNGVCDIRDFLMEAYNNVGREFNCFPKYPISVILYKENEFRIVNNVPGFVAGLYDGKIRIPVNFSRYPPATLKGILFHEYAHAVVHDLTANTCPIWLNEGIAMRAMNSQSPVPSKTLYSALQSNATLSLEQLTNPSTWHNSKLVPLAYSQSWIMAEYLFYRWSNSQITKLLQQLKFGTAFDTMLQKDMNRTPEQFTKEWIEFAQQRQH